MTTRRILLLSLAIPLIIIVNILVLFPYQTSYGQAESLTNFKTYDNPLFSISIQYPSDWNILNDTSSSSSHVIFYKSSSIPDADTSNNLYLQYLRSSDADVSAGVQITDYSSQPLKELVQNDFANYARVFFHFQIIESTPTLIDRNPAYKEIHTFADDKGKAYTYTAIYTAKEDKLYKIWYRVVSEQYPDYLDIGQKILNSFKFTSPT
jgi:PsbP-like protein